VAAVKKLRAGGVPVIGYTWFPLFTMVDWRYRLGRRAMNHYYINLGLYKLDDAGSGRRWKPTMLVDQLKEFMRDPLASVGPIAV
jgi:hypothetical protein